MNPFITTGYEGPEYFCDRIKETEDLIGLLKNKNNVLLSAPRRIGKTDLIRHCLHQFEQTNKYYVFFVDVFDCRNADEFTLKLANAILSKLSSKGETLFKRFINAINSIRPTCTFDSIGNPTFSYSITNVNSKETTLEEIFTFISKADLRCIIAIDEFQQIVTFPETNFAATLRTYMQRCPNANFVFSGSSTHLINDMFLSHAKPFYQSAVAMGLEAIPFEKYSDFCIEKFQEYGKGISSEAIKKNYDSFHGVTLYIQRIMNIVFERTSSGETAGEKSVEEAIEYLVGLSGSIYESLLYQIPDRQKDLLLAIARDGSVKDPTSSDFVYRHRLKSASSVQSALKGLTEKDLVSKTGTLWHLNDEIFRIYLERR